ncbi:hypothetical protein MTYP_01501 [Methylophilaceae bacterium]|nr:hypothetical protein MTYP_01501 [Methylophilaceae bacterium]
MLLIMNIKINRVRSINPVTARPRRAHCKQVHPTRAIFIESLKELPEYKEWRSPLGGHHGKQGQMAVPVRNGMKLIKSILLVMLYILLFGCAKWWDGGASGR